MLVPVENISIQHSYKRIYRDKNVKNFSPFSYDAVSFKSKQLTVRKILKFAIPSIFSSIGIINIMPNTILNKFCNIELEDLEYRLVNHNEKSKKEEIDSHISDIKKMINENPNKTKIIEKLLRKEVFDSLGETKYFTQENPELFDTQLNFLSRMIDEKKYERYTGISSLYDSATQKIFSKEDIDAKNKMLDYILEFNQNYEKSER